MMKKIFLILFITLLLCSFVFANEYCYLNDNWNPNILDDPSLIFSGGTGLVSDPYVITNCVQLQMINCDDARILVTNLSGLIYGRANFILGNDINCYNDTHQNGKLWFDGQGFAPVNLDPTLGCDSLLNGKGATFDGNHHKITGLYINRSGYVGLFDSIDYAVIKNLSVEVDLNLYSGTTGGLVAYARNSVIDNCSVSGTIKGRSPVGGIIGSSYRVYLKNSVNNASILSHSGDYIGGLIGYSGSSIISNSKNLGQIRSIGDSSNNIGGLVGYLSNGIIIDSNNGKENYLILGRVISGRYNIGGIAGYSINSIISKSINYSPLAPIYEGTYSNVDVIRNVGGLVGNMAYSVILNSINVKDVNGFGGVVGNPTYSGSNIGGLVGQGFNFSINSAYVSGNVFAQNCKAGIFVGDASYCSLSGLTWEGLINPPCVPPCVADSCTGAWSKKTCVGPGPWGSSSNIEGVPLSHNEESSNLTSNYLEWEMVDHNSDRTSRKCEMWCSDDEVLMYIDGVLPICVTPEEYNCNDGVEWDDWWCVLKEVCVEDNYCNQGCPSGFDPDCLIPICGDNHCDDGEDYSSCPQDCSLVCAGGDSVCPNQCNYLNDSDCPPCLNTGVCDSNSDCCSSSCVGGSCVPQFATEGICGDGVIDEGENCSNCPEDVICQNDYYCEEGICIKDELDCSSDGVCNEDCPIGVDLDCGCVSVDGSCVSNSDCCSGLVCGAESKCVSTSSASASIDVFNLFVDGNKLYYKIKCNKEVPIDINLYKGEVSSKNLVRVNDVCGVEEKNGLILDSVEEKIIYTAIAKIQPLCKVCTKTDYLVVEDLVNPTSVPDNSLIFTIVVLLSVVFLLNKKYNIKK